MAPSSFLRLAVMATFFIAVSAAQTQSKTQVSVKAKVQSQKGLQVQLSPAETALVFEPNRGQAAANFEWIGRGAGFRVGIGSDGATLEFVDHAAVTPPKPRIPDTSELLKAQPKQKRAPSALVRLHLPGSSGWKAAGVEPTGGTSNYFIGKTPENWRTDIPQFYAGKGGECLQGC